MAEAAKQNIPVIAYDRLIMGSPHVSYFVGFDSKEIGRIQGRAVWACAVTATRRNIYNSIFLIFS